MPRTREMTKGHGPGSRATLDAATDPLPAQAGIAAPDTDSGGF
jgi:hypothetical protein